MDVAKFMRDLVAPEGFTKVIDETTGGWGDKTFPRATFTGHEGQTTIEVWITDPKGKDMYGSGHTRFKTSQGEFSFDRRGVEDSFYVWTKEKAEDINPKLVEQAAKAAATRERHTTSVKVPQIGFVITPEQKVEITAKLKAGKTHTFYPSGFGTAYVLTTKRPRHPYGTGKATAELAAFFGQTTLFYETQDHD